MYERVLTKILTMAKPMYEEARTDRDEICYKLDLILEKFSRLEEHLEHVHEMQDSIAAGQETIMEFIRNMQQATNTE